MAMKLLAVLLVLCCVLLVKNLLLEAFICLYKTYRNQNALYCGLRLIISRSEFWFPFRACLLKTTSSRLRFLFGSPRLKQFRSGGLFINDDSFQIIGPMTNIEMTCVAPP